MKPEDQESTSVATLDPGPDKVIAPGHDYGTVTDEIGGVVFRPFLKTPPLAEGFAAHRDELLDRFETFRPAEGRYSPLSFFFNFSHNVVKGTVVDALLRGEPWNLTLNDLLTGIPRGDRKEESKVSLARTLMGYARSNPDTIRGRLSPVIVYDARAGRRAFALAMRKIMEP